MHIIAIIDSLGCYKVDSQIYMSLLTHIFSVPLNLFCHNRMHPRHLLSFLFPACIYLKFIFLSFRHLSELNSKTIILTFLSLNILNF